MSIDNNSISEEYNKYLVKIIFSSNEYYTITGIDPELGDDDVFLSNGKGVLLFPSLEEVKLYINKEENSIFDSVNSKKWINSLSSDVPYTNYDFDLVESKLKKWTASFDVLADENQDFLLELFDIIAFAKDLKYQFLNEEIEQILEIEEFINFDDILYDNFIWASNNKNKVERKLLTMMKEPSLVKNIIKLLKRIYPLFLIYPFSGNLPK